MATQTPSKTELTIGYSLITERVYLGRIKQNDTSHWTGDKQDITSRFIEVLLQKFEPGGAHEVHDSTGKKYLITVTEIDDAFAEMMAALPPEPYTKPDKEQKP